jgi:outer membrane protein assembly factor BamB
MKTAILFLASTAAALAADDSNWPRWRGPSDNGSAGAGAYPVTWSAAANILWKTPLPGKGCSTPIVWNQRILLTAPVDGQDAALAFDWSGRPLWRTVIGPERPGKHRNASGCNPAPATDGGGVFVYFKSGNLAALDLDGKLRWKTNLQERFGKDTLWWDIGTSPALTARDVIIAVMHEGSSYLAAFDKAGGKLRWKVARNFTTALEGDHSYATPLVIRHADREAVLAWGAEHLTAHDAADGRTLWTCGDFNPDQRRNWPAVASPVVAGNMAVVPYGRGERLHGIRLGGSGDVTATHRVWKREDTGSFVPTPAESNGRVFVLGDKGKVECVAPDTGRTLWSGELPKHKSKFYASPVVAGGRLYAAREDGVVFVARIQDRFELLAENDMADRIIASPVPVAGRLLLRGEQCLYCIGAD